MKLRSTMMHLKIFQLKEKRRQLSQLEMMIEEFELMLAELKDQIEAEERKTGLYNIDHFAYSTVARAARLRSKNLAHSLEGLKVQRTNAIQAVAEAEFEVEAVCNREKRLKKKPNAEISSALVIQKAG